MTLEQWPHKPISQMKKQRLKRGEGTCTRIHSVIWAQPSRWEHQCRPLLPRKRAAIEMAKCTLNSRCFLPTFSSIRTNTLGKAHGPWEDYISQLPLQLGIVHATTSWPVKWNQIFSSCSFYGNSSHLFFVLLLATQHGMWDLSSLTRYGTRAPCIGSRES